MSSSFNFMGRQYKADEWLKDTTSFAKLLAENAKIVQPLPSETDLTEVDRKEVVNQVKHRQDTVFLNYFIDLPAAILQLNAMLALPEFVVKDFWAAFAANYLPALSTTLLSLSPTIQRRYTSTLVLILSLLPEPKDEPYFRRFLCVSPLARDLPNFVGGLFATPNGIEMMRPGGPGHISAFIIYCLFWCDSSRGDDGKACINADIRKAIATKLKGFQSSQELFSRLEVVQQVEIERLAGILNAVGEMPGNQYLKSTKEYLEDKAEWCGKADCDGEREATMTCSKCKTVRYCGKEHQKWHWKNGHKLRCFEATF